jgi:diguanylate cyclase (GGDEF)-like protein/PAS domain S-box-containing protein
MTASTSTLTIQLVDDDPSDLAALQGVLGGQGYRLLGCRRDYAGLAGVVADPPELLLLDARHSTADSAAWCRALRASPALSDVPVLVICAAGDVGAFSACGAECVTSPFRPEEILARVRELLELRRARGALSGRTTEERSQQLLQAQRIARIGAWSIDVERDLIEWIGETHRMFGFENPEALSFSDSLQHAHPDDRARVQQAWEEAIASAGGRYEVVYRVRVDGDERWVHEIAEIERDANGHAVRALGTVQDVTERKAYEVALEAQQQRLETALEAANAGAWEWDVRARSVRAGEWWARMLGYPPQQVGNLALRDWEEFAHPQDRDRVKGVLKEYLAGKLPAFEVEYRIRHRKGHWVWVRSVGRVIRRDARGRPAAIAGIDVDITGQKTYQQQLAYIASHDELTGLPNRMFFVAQLAGRLESCLRRGGRLAVCYIDLDGLAEINEQHGQAFGDELLKKLAERLVAACGAEITARTGGDEFACLMESQASEEDFTLELERLMAQITAPVRVRDKQCQVTASLGVAVFPQHAGIDAEQLLRQADQAMYQSKLSGKNRYTFFDAERDEHTREYRARLEEIRRGIDLGQFILHYQPKVNIRSGTVLGFEALARWLHPERGLVSAGEFIPLLEDHPLAAVLGDRVIEMALQQLAEWNAAGLRTRLSVNVTSMQLHDAGFIDRLSRQFAAQPSVSRAQLELEVVETGAMQDVARVAALVSQLDEMGIAVALDDFGTGFSSLTFLKQLPARTIKIDQSFVRDLLDDEEHAVIVDSICGLAESFTRQVIAEGVESEIHGRLLLELGCELGQGYAIARPMPAEEVPRWLQAWRPLESWSESVTLERARVPELLAELGHRAWRNAVRAYLEGRRKAPPERDANLCKLGSWLNNPANIAQLGEMPAFREAERLHTECHALLGPVLDQATIGIDMAQSPALEQMFELSNRVLDLLKDLRKRP